MNKLDLKATYFILTGKIEGSQKGRFIGRSAEEIIRETAEMKTNQENFFERASLIGFTGTDEGLTYHSTAGSQYESGRVQEAYQTIDEAYRKLRNGQLKDLDEVVYHDNDQDTTSWDDLRKYAGEGHEIASHTITHPRLAVLDEKNLMFELQQSQADIRSHLGEAYTFSAECPYGTENERVMTYAHSVYPALRNRMPSDYMEELNRSSSLDPGSSQKEYVQWQRGPLSATSMELMKSWVDTCLVHDNIWLVLVFHGVGHLGWEPKTKEELTTYFNYMKQREDQIWIAPFGEVTKYIRERKDLKIETETIEGDIVLNLASTLDPEVYNVPLTLKTYVPKKWKHIEIKNQEEILYSHPKIYSDDSGSYVLYDIFPDEKQVVIHNGS
jgi:peptidoglycan/xylan/chitin deacetylase (PgdA/CDA1 family)